MSSERSDAYVATHLSVIGVALGGAYAARFLTAAPTLDDGGWFGDRTMRGRFSQRASDVSDGTLALTVAFPLAATAAHAPADLYGNAALIYGETISINLLANAVVKYAVRRPRPLAYSPLGLLNLANCDEQDDHCLSFYSGHSSTAFASAVSGSLLFSDTESAPMAWRMGVWGAEMMLAMITAQLRVKAGKHFYSDVVIGALVGTVFGVVVPVLHGLRGFPDPREAAAATGGLALGALLAQLAPSGWSLSRGEPGFGLAPFVKPDGAVGLTLRLGSFEEL